MTQVSTLDRLYGCVTMRYSFCGYTNDSRFDRYSDYITAWQLRMQGNPKVTPIAQQLRCSQA